MTCVFLENLVNIFPMRDEVALEHKSENKFLCKMFLPLRMEERTTIRRRGMESIMKLQKNEQQMR